MADIDLKRDDPVFLFIEQYIRSAIKKHIDLEMEWAIEKIFFEETWEAHRLHHDIEAEFNLQIADIDIGVDFENEEDPETLTNCFVTLRATDALEALLREFDVSSEFVIDVCNDVIGTNVLLLSEEDVENKVSLLHVKSTKSAVNAGLIDQLKNNFSTKS